MFSGTPQNSRRTAVELSIRASQIREAAIERSVRERRMAKRHAILAATQRALEAQR